MKLRLIMFVSLLIVSYPWSLQTMWIFYSFTDSFRGCFSNSTLQLSCQPCCFKNCTCTYCWKLPCAKASNTGTDLIGSCKFCLFCKICEAQCLTRGLLWQGAVSALHMIHCFHLAGFPKGLISCITGKGSEIGDFLTLHPGVNCIRWCLGFFLFYS